MRIAAVEPTVSSSRSQRATVFRATPTASAKVRCVMPSALRTRRTSPPVTGARYVRDTTHGKSLARAAGKVAFEVGREEALVFPLPDGRDDATAA